MNTKQYLQSQLKTVIADYSAFAERRAARQRLVAEIDSFRTPAEIEDMLASLDRAEGPQIEWMRARLSDNLVRYNARQHLALGLPTAV